MEKSSSTRIVGAEKVDLKISDDVIKHLNLSTQNTLKKASEHLIIDKTNDQIKFKNLLSQDSFRNYNEIIECFKKPNSLKSILNRFSNLNEFKNFESIIILYHLRGQLTANAVHMNMAKKFSNYKVEISSFTPLFNQIRKSKNKIFNNSQYPVSILPILGTYLAQTIRTNFYDLIFIVSRNDFLPPESSEINRFNFIVDHCLPYFSCLLQRKENETKIELIKEIFDKSLFPFQIFANGKEIYRSQNFEDNKEVDVIENADSQTTLQIQRMSTNSRTSEIFHFQRIAVLGELLNTLQHELSNPLFGIKLTSELILLEEENQDSRDFIAEIYDSTVRCQSIIKDFSTLYQMKNEQETFNLIKIIKEAITLSKSATQNIIKELKVDDPNDGIEIYSNPRWIHHIIFNALINSAQALNSEPHNPDKKIIIIIEKTLTEIVIKVIDNGPGLRGVNEPTLFSPFYTTKSDGTGLGLSICKNLADKLGADVYLKNGDKKGCVFTLVLKNEKNINC